MSGLDKLAEGVGKAIETVPELYQDAFQPAVQESGKFIARIPRAINAAFAGLDKWILNKEYSIDETKKLLAQKLETIDPEKIVEPEPYVAVPAIQAISYSMNSEELRNLYANLLAKSMIADTKGSVHPSFVEIIKQMSPMDAQIFKIIMESQIRPLIDIKIKTKNEGFDLIYEHCSWISQFSIQQCCTSFNNLSRLGLIEIPFGESYTSKQNYTAVRQNPNFKLAESKVRSVLSTDQSISYDEQHIKTNEFAKLFYEICIQNP